MGWDAAVPWHKFFRARHVTTHGGLASTSTAAAWNISLDEVDLTSRHRLNLNGPGSTRAGKGTLFVPEAENERSTLRDDLRDLGSLLRTGWIASFTIFYRKPEARKNTWATR
jgi:hypothetical protein